MAGFVTRNNIMHVLQAPNRKESYSSNKIVYDETGISIFICTCNYNYIHTNRSEHISHLKLSNMMLKQDTERKKQKCSVKSEDSRCLKYSDRLYL